MPAKNAKKKNVTNVKPARTKDSSESSEECFGCPDCNDEKNLKKEVFSEIHNETDMCFLFEPLNELFKKNRISMAQKNNLIADLLTRFVFYQKEKEKKMQNFAEEQSKEVEKLREMLSEKFDANRYVQVMLGAMEGRFQEMNEQNEETEKEKNKIEEELKKFKKEAKDLKKENDLLKKANLRSLTVKANEGNSEIAKLKKKLEMQDQELKKLQFNKKDKEKLKSLETIVLKKDERIESMDKEIDTLENALQDAKKSLSTYAKCKTSEAAETQRLKEKLEKKRIQISEIQLANRELQTELIRSQQSILNKNIEVEVIQNLEKTKISEAAKKSGGKSNPKKSKSGTENRQKIPELMKLDLGDPASKVTNAKNIKDGKKKCSVCLKNLETKEVQESCKHCSNIFHSLCVLPWVRNSGSCPSCRLVLQQH